MRGAKGCRTDGADGGTGFPARLQGAECTPSSGANLLHAMHKKYAAQMGGVSIRKTGLFQIGVLKHLLTGQNVTGLVGGIQQVLFGGFFPGLA